MVFQREVIRPDRKIEIQAIAGTPLPAWLAHGRLQCLSFRLVHCSSPSLIAGTASKPAKRSASVIGPCSTRSAGYSLTTVVHVTRATNSQGLPTFTSTITTP